MDRSNGLFCLVLILLLRHASGLRSNFPKPPDLETLNLSRPTSLHLLRANRSPTVDLQIDPGNELTLITRQKCGHIRDIAWIRQPSQGHIEQEFLHVLFGVRNANEGLEEACAAEQRAEGVHADLVFAEFCCEAFCCLSTESV